MKILAKTGAVFDRFLNALIVLACVIFTFTMLLVSTDVILRYVFNSPIAWTTEVCEYILVGIVSLGMAWLLRREGHVKVDFLLNQFSPGTQALINAFTSILAAAVLFIITWYGIQNILFLLGKPLAVETGILRIHKAVLLIPLAMGCLLVTIQFMRRTYKNLQIYRQARKQKGVVLETDHEQELQSFGG